jgi:hypothetical protein
VDAGLDAYASRRDAMTDSAADAPAGDALSVVALCQATAHSLAAMCTGSTMQQCFWNAYASLCATGYTTLLLDSMGCLDTTTCSAFSDADASTCLGNVHQFDESNASKSFVQSVCNACGNPCPNIGGAAEVIPYLTQADDAALSSCSMGACTIDDVIKDSASIPDVAYFNACE